MMMKRRKSKLELSQQKGQKQQRKSKLNEIKQIIHE
jgi:hypothetical protein